MKGKPADPLTLARRRAREKEREFSGFSAKALGAIERCVRQKHPWESICHKDVKVLSKEERREVNRVVHARIQAMRRAVWLGEEE